jgi:hypothetical protein
MPKLPKPEKIQNTCGLHPTRAGVGTDSDANLTTSVINVTITPIAVGGGKPHWTVSD